MVQIPLEYGPLIVGRGQYTAELMVTEPFMYSVGFAFPLFPTDARRVLEDAGISWALAEPTYIVGSEVERSEFTFIDRGASSALAPANISEVIVASDDIRHIVPVYRGLDETGGTFTPVPNHVVVTGRVGDESTLAALDEISGGQGFFALLYRDTLVDGTIRRIYSSRILEAAVVPQVERQGYEGEFGPALSLINELRSWSAGLQLEIVAEPDWYLANPNDLGTLSTRQGDAIDSEPVPVVTVTVDMDAVKVAVLDGEFDLSHVSGKLPFSQPYRNSILDNAEVKAKAGHAHGTLCAGLIGARSGIKGWIEGGVARDASIIPISVYVPRDPIEAEVNHLVDGINFAVTNGCKILSISLAGFAPSSSLIDAVERAERCHTLLVAGTGNRRIEEMVDPGAVQFPARFGTVVGVGAAIKESNNGVDEFSRVTLDLSETCGEPAVWESCYGTGIDVVAPGLRVTSTDISGYEGADPRDSPEGDIWDRFSGTSAATPVVAGLAAVISAATGGTPQQIRDEIRCAARKLGPYDYDLIGSRPGWHPEVGYGWIDHDVVDQWKPCSTGSPTGTPGTTTQLEEDIISDSTATADDSTITCGVSEDLGQFTDVGVFPYAGSFTTALRPLADFLGSLGSTSATCSTMAAHFWRDPYRTARIAGLPWHAAVLLGGGDWAAVYAAVDVEYHRTANSAKPPGPIWVRAR
jgi:subtilisin family serine protease